jgi:predicted tellurium resistance membrane protein TerC
MIQRFMPRAASVDAGAARARPAGIRRAATPLVALVAAIALADLAFALVPAPVAGPHRGGQS